MSFLVIFLWNFGNTLCITTYNMKKRRLRNASKIYCVFIRLKIGLNVLLIFLGKIPKIFNDAVLEIQNK